MVLAKFYEFIDNLIDVYHVINGYNNYRDNKRVKNKFNSKEYLILSA